MVEWLADIYSHNRWFRLAVCVALFLSGGLLFWASGGFPPWAWRFLFQVLTQLSALWRAQGTAILIPLVGLVFLSAALLIMWLILGYSVCKLALHWWHDIRAQKDFSAAEQMAEQMSWQEASRQARPDGWDAFQAEWQPQSAPLIAANEPQPVQQAQTAQPYAVARASRPVRAAAGAGPVSTYTQTRPVVAPERMPSAAPTTGNLSARRDQTGNLSARRDQLRLVPREPEPISEPEGDADYETLFEIEHALIETSDLHMASTARSKALEEVHTDSLGRATQTEELQAELRLVVGIGLDPGIVRKNAPNEDNLFAIQAMRTGKSGPHPVGLFVVADGMGGHANGQEASRLAIQVISDAIVPALLRVDADEDSFANLLKEGVHRANLALYQHNREQPEMMGTTLTTALIINDRAYIANVGDSRTYCYRPTEGLMQVTRDHSHVARLVEEGAITRDEIYTHPRRNQIYRCLGERSTVEVDSFERDLAPGDVLLLCSDGLWEMVRDNTLQDIIVASTPHPSQISSMLVQSALSRGGADNISAVVVCVAQPEE